MAHCENSFAAVKYLIVVDLKAGQRTIFLTNTGDARVKVHFAAKGDDALSDVLHHLQQHIGADMGLGVVENILPCAGSNKLR